MSAERRPINNLARRKLFGGRPGDPLSGAGDTPADFSIQLASARALASTAHLRRRWGRRKLISATYLVVGVGGADEWGQDLRDGPGGARGELAGALWACGQQDKRNEPSDNNNDNNNNTSSSNNNCTNSNTAR